MLAGEPEAFTATALKCTRWLGGVLGLMQPICLHDLESQDIVGVLILY